ncbi:MAG: diguanylate cyclase [Actinomycetes bacterium]
MKIRRLRLHLSRSRGMFLAALSVVTILAAQIIVSVIGAIVADRGNRDAAEDTYSYIGELMNERVGSFVDNAADTVTGVVHEIERDGVMPDTDALTRMLADRVSRENSVSALFVGRLDGAMTVLVEERNGFMRLDIVPGIDGGPTLITRTLLTASLDVRSSFTEASEYDLLERPWFLRAMTSVTVTWTEPYISARTGDVAVSPVEAVAVDGKIEAVVGAELDIDRLALLLDNIPLGDEARAFILTSDGRVVAAPSGRRDALRDAIDGSTEVPEGGAIGLPSIAPPPGAPVLEGDQVRLVRQLDSAAGVDWELHLEARAKDLTPGLYRTQIATYVVTAVSILVLVASVMLLARLWRPVRVMRDRASTDALTGLANRYEFQRQGRALVTASAEDDTVVLVLALDLDDLKSVNDSFGHEAGDAVIKAVGRVLLDSVRVRDVAARLGGDEFVVVMRLDSRASAAEVARRLRDDAARAVAGAHRGGVLAGVTAGFTTSADSGYDLRAMVSAADTALMAGKRVEKGRTYGPDCAPQDLKPADILPGN